VCRENLNPEDLATQSVRLKEEQLRREEGRLKEIEVAPKKHVIVSNISVESAKGDFGSQTRTSCQRRSTQISRSSSRYKSKLQYLAHTRRNSCSRKSVSAVLISKPRGEKKGDWWIIFF
jgi:phage-related protein